MRVRIKDVGQVITGNTPSKSIGAFYDSEDIGFIKPDALSDEHIINIYEGSNYISEKAREKARIVKDKAVLVTCIGSIGKIGIVSTNEVAFNQQINAIIPNEKVDYRYLAYCILGNRERLVRKANAPVVPIVNKTEFELFEIDIEANINEQLQIVHELDNVRRIIEIREEQLRKSDDLIKARFVEMFGELKLNPMRWPIVAFPDFAIIDGNMTTDYEKYADYPHIGIDSIEKGTGELKGYRTVREDGVISGKYLFTPQHIIYSKIRPNLNKVALPTFTGLCSADAYPILPNDENCNRIYLATAMRSQYFLDYILQFSGRTNLPKVNRKEISGFKMPLPPLKLQEQFAAFVEQIDKSKAIINQQIEQLQKLFDSKMAEYFG